MQFPYFVAKTTLPKQEVIIPLQKSLSNIRKDPDAAKFKFAFVAFDVQVATIEDADFNELRELLKKAKKDNWIKDFEKWVKAQKQKPTSNFKKNLKTAHLLLFQNS